MATRSGAWLALALFASSISSTTLAEEPTEIESFRARLSECQTYTSESDFGPRAKELRASALIQPIDSFGHALPLGVSRVEWGGVAHELGLRNGDIILQPTRVAAHLARPPLWLFCLVESGEPFDVRVQRYAGRQITLTFPGRTAD